VTQDLSYYFKESVRIPPEFSANYSIYAVCFISSKFAIITPALITGAFAERIRFWAHLLFMVLFIIFVYAPLCHMTWHPEGVFFFKKWFLILLVELLYT
jgi:Amt family ammonium transporter